MGVEQNYTVLVIEDDEDVRSLLQSVLKGGGFNVDFAVDGQEGLDIINSGNPPDLILLDIMLPFIDGLELLAKIQAQDDWADVPVVLLTAQDTADDIKQGFRAGAADYIVKPFIPGELIEKILSLLEPES